MGDWKKVREKIRQGALKEMWKEGRWVLNYIIRYRKAVIFYIMIGVTGTLLSLGGSLTSKYAIDAVTGHQIQLLIGMVVLFAITGFGGIALNAVMTRMLTKISLRINQEILSDVYYKILNTEWQYMNQYHSGDLLNRINTDVSQVAGSVLGWVPSLIIKSVHFIGSLLIILYFDPTMALFALCSAPITVLISRVVLYKMRDYNRQMRKASSDMMGFTEESFQQMQSIKSMHLIDLFRNRLKSVQGAYVEKALEYNEFSVRTSAFLSTVSMIVSFLCMGWGVYRLWTGCITYGTMTLFLQLARSLSTDFSALIRMIPSAIGALTSAGRIMDVTELPQEDKGNEKQISLIREKSKEGLKISLEQAGFAYEKGSPVLETVNFSADPGEIVALVGKSGSGKTTLLRVILGILHCQEGSAKVFAAGDICEPLGAGTRDLISYVPQGNTVFSGTIADNLRMVKLDADDGELEDALKTACAWEFVEKLPKGINTVVGERGTGLSEGQAQRIAIARAVLKKAPVILFDEATSALDETTGKQVLFNIREKLENCTCIVVTHRESILTICNRIYQLDNHRVKEWKLAEKR